MITSLSWLKNHLSTKANLNQIAERLTEIGLEVENIKSSNDNLDNFIVCKIVKSEKHPIADKLKLCDVDIGSRNLVKVVLSGDYELKSISISDAAKKESQEIINDLIIAAYNNAKENLKKKSAEELSKATGGLNLPIDFKLPF